MPIYDYLCARCGRRVEVIHGVHVAGPTQCEQCGGALRKAVSVPAIVFKGSGWAKVDARTTGARAPSGDGGAKSDKAEVDGAAKSPDSSAPAADKSDATPTAKPAAGSADAKGTSG